MTQRNRKPSRSKRPSPSSDFDESPTVSPGDLLPEDLVDPTSRYHQVALQLQALGNSHIGYGHKQIPGKHITVAGGRPFSKVSN